MSACVQNVIDYNSSTGVHNNSIILLAHVCCYNNKY